MTTERPKKDTASRPRPFTGVRVLEVSATRAGRIAGMLLSDLGADVVRVVAASAITAPPSDPGELCWDRGKRLMRIDADQCTALLPEADVLLVDYSPESLFKAGLDAAGIDPQRTGLVHVWMPPYAPKGEWSEVEEDPLLLAGVGGIAGHFPAVEDRPVAPVVATTTYIQGAMGAAAVAAGLLGRGRQGQGHAVVVSGLHAAAAQMAAMMIEGLDHPIVSPSRSVQNPNWRMYRGSDGLWFFLAALTPELFLRTLSAINRIDLLLLPGVDGEFSNILADNAAKQAVAAELEVSFAARPRQYWLDVLSAADLPCAAVGKRTEWMESSFVRANGGTVTREHSDLGKVVMPGVPVTLSSTPGMVGEFPARDIPSVTTGQALWAARSEARPLLSEPKAVLPLEGLNIVDASSFLAGPFISSFLAEHGAEVIRIEPLSGDTYRAYAMSFMAVNKLKQGLAVDIQQPEGRDVLLTLVGKADALVENFRPSRLRRMGLEPERLAEENPALVHCSVSAYGQDEQYAEAPGFDPVFQALSGMASAQGGEAGPIVVGMPSADTATGALGALGVLAGLYARRTTGTGQRVSVALASACTFMQSGELTQYSGRPEPVQGSVDYPGPHAGHRYYRCSDGWIGMAATTGTQMASLEDVFGCGGHEEIQEALRRQTVTEATNLLASRGIPAARVVQRQEALQDPFLEANNFSQVIKDARFGRVRIVRGYSDWGTDAGRAIARSLRVGEDTRRILVEAGYEDQQIEQLMERSIVAEPTSHEMTKAAQ